MVRNFNPERIVVKIGTSTLTKEGSLDKKFIQSLADEIANLKREGKEIVLVSSGAIGAGCSELGIKTKSQDVKMQQATAAIGQGLLMQAYHDAFTKYDIKIGQILLTYEDFSDRKTYLNLRNSMNTIISLGAIPIVNENDAISINEIGPSFGDNDKLSALVASKLEADTLIIMSDINGLYDKNPKKNKDAKLIKRVTEISEKIEFNAGKSGSSFGLGGMKSKIEAAKICMTAGVYMIICDGREKEVITKIIDRKEVGTIFIPNNHLNNKKRWIIEAKAKGTITVDEGAKKAMKNGKHLLPIGITKVEGRFESGDIVNIQNKKVFAKTIIDYSSEELEKMKGKKSSENKRNGNVTRKDNLVFV
ncbi:glutamate 5-kinase [Candidatus Woesearchaeota archaeon]|nr:glutamate 5-kinase [Candidatus Woesearchaeota archaeon]